MRFRTPFLAATLVTLGCACLASSATLTITLKNGQVVTYNMNDVQQVVYSGDNVTAPVATPAPAPKVMNWAGVWRTDDNSIGTITMSLNGNTLTGTYPHQSGRIVGTVSGNTFKGNWTQSNGKGGFNMTLSADGRSIVGTWNYAGGTTMHTFKATRQ